MTTPARQILKTITEITRYRADLRKHNTHNLHIGRTMRDLHKRTEGKPNKRIEALLDELERNERSKRQ